MGWCRGRERRRRYFPSTIQHDRYQHHMCEGRPPPRKRSDGHLQPARAAFCRSWCRRQAARDRFCPSTTQMLRCPPRSRDLHLSLWRLGAVLRYGGELLSSIGWSPCSWANRHTEPGLLPWRPRIHGRLVGSAVASASLLLANASTSQSWSYASCSPTGTAGMAGTRWCLPTSLPSSKPVFTGMPACCWDWPQDCAD
jgi:hypothetical protein